MRGLISVEKHGSTEAGNGSLMAVFQNGYELFWDGWTSGLNKDGQPVKLPLYHGFESIPDVIAVAMGLDHSWLLDELLQEVWDSC